MTAKIRSIPSTYFSRKFTKGDILFAFTIDEGCSRICTLAQSINIFAILCSPRVHALSFQSWIKLFIIFHSSCKRPVCNRNKTLECKGKIDPVIEIFIFHYCSIYLSGYFACTTIVIFTYLQYRTKNTILFTQGTTKFSCFVCVRK